MSFRSEAAVVRGKLAAGDFKKPADDPYGFLGFAEQVTHGIRADAEQRRQEELMEKKEEFARKRAAAEKQAAKDAAEKKLRGYVTAALQGKVNNYGAPLTKPKGLNDISNSIFTHASDMGLTTYAQVQDLVGNINATTFDQLFAKTGPVVGPTAQPTVQAPDELNVTPDNSFYVNGYKVAPVPDAERGTHGWNYSIVGGTFDSDHKTVRSKEQLTELLNNKEHGGLSPTESGETIDQTTAALSDDAGSSSQAKEMNSLFGNPTSFDTGTLTSENWENEVATLERMKVQRPNQKDWDAEIQRVRDYVTGKGWVKTGGLDTQQQMEIETEKLRDHIGLLEAGHGTQQQQEGIPFLKDLLITKEDLDENGAWFNSDEEIWAKLEESPAIVLSSMRFWGNSNIPANKAKLDRVNAAKDLYDLVVSEQGLSTELMEKALGKGAEYLKGFKKAYGEKATAQQNGLIEKLIIIAEETDQRNKEPMALAWDSFAARSGLYENLKSTDPTVREAAEKSIATWKKAWAMSISIAAKPAEFWENPVDLADLNLDQIENLFVIPDIINNPAAVAALTPIRERLQGVQTSGQVTEDENEIIGLNSVAAMDNWMLSAGNRAALDSNPELSNQWVLQRVNLLVAENEADAEKNIDAYQQIWRNELGDRNLADLTSEEIAEIDKKAKELTRTDTPFVKRTYYNAKGDSQEVRTQAHQDELEAAGWSAIKLGDVSQMLSDLGLPDNADNRALMAKVNNNVFKITANNVGYPVIVDTTADSMGARPIGTGGDLSVDQNRRLIMNEVSNTIGSEPYDTSGDTSAVNDNGEIEVVISAEEKKQALEALKSVGFELSIEELVDPSAAFGPKGWGYGLLNKVAGVGGGTANTATGDASAVIDSLRLITTLQISAAFPGLKDSVNLRDSIKDKLPEVGKFWVGVPEATRGYKAIRALLVSNVNVQIGIMNDATNVRGIDYAKAAVAIHTLEPLIDIYDALIEGMSEVGQVADTSGVDQQDFTVPKDFKPNNGEETSSTTPPTVQSMIVKFSARAESLGKVVDNDVIARALRMSGYSEDDIKAGMGEDYVAPPKENN